MKPYQGDDKTLPSQSWSGHALTTVPCLEARIKLKGRKRDFKKSCGFMLSPSAQCLYP